MGIGATVREIYENIPINEWVGKIWGSNVETDRDRFGRTVYRLCAAQAMSTQLDVYAFWFGETVRVQPNGQYMVVGRPLVISGFETYINQLRLGGYSFYVIRCDKSVKWEDSGSIQQGCNMDPYGEKTKTPTPGLPPVPGGGPTTAGFIGIAALVGIALLFFWKK